MQRLDNAKEIVDYIKSLHGIENKIYIFQIKNSENNTILRTVAVFNHSVTIKDYEHNTEFINSSDIKTDSIVEYELVIPIELYKSCAIIEKSFILDYNVLNKIKTINEKGFIDAKLIRWFIKSVSISNINCKLEAINGIPI